jgi:hypothetical protein
MIISASRRTDIPAHYSDWFFKTLDDGGTVVKNPFNPKQARFVDLSVEAVGGFVFWSKNPEPMIERLSRLSEYPFYFQYTLNAYKDDIEPGTPPISTRLETFKRLSCILGQKRVIWRYDPIFTSKDYSAQWHAESFDMIAATLRGFTRSVTISFFDTYRSIVKNMRRHGIIEPDEQEILGISSNLAQIARSAGIKISACAEKADLSSYGISKGRCVDAVLLAEISEDLCRGSSYMPGSDACTNSVDAATITYRSGNRFDYAALNRKDPNQRPECGCAKSVDIGSYGTCPSGCAYCYARGNASQPHT